MTLSFLMKLLENSTPSQSSIQGNRIWNTNSYVVKSEDGTDQKGVITSQVEKKNWKNATM